MPFAAQSDLAVRKQLRQIFVPEHIAHHAAAVPINAVGSSRRSSGDSVPRVARIGRSDSHRGFLDFSLYLRIRGELTLVRANVSVWLRITMGQREFSKCPVHCGHNRAPFK
jgi:hypothetical protein